MFVALTLVREGRAAKNGWPKNNNPSFGKKTSNDLPH
jgi:hypothetical protein